MAGFSRRHFLKNSLSLSCAAAGLSAKPSALKQIVFIAGQKSHGFGQHAHANTCLFLAKCLKEGFPALETTVMREQWPDDSTLRNAATIVLSMDGGENHPMLPHMKVLGEAMERGCGLVMLHYALDVPKGEAGNRVLDWLGGYYEEYWSVNPMWYARFDSLPQHPITRGARPFASRDEWYFHMRFREGMQGITPILTAVPPDAVREKPFGPHSGNPTVRAEKGKADCVAWAYDRPRGGRGFGFSGCHYHWALKESSFRNVLANGIAWTAGLEVPAGGVAPRTPTWEELTANQEGEPPAGFNEQRALDLVLPGR